MVYKLSNHLLTRLIKFINRNLKYKPSSEIKILWFINYNFSLISVRGGAADNCPRRGSVPFKKFTTTMPFFLFICPFISILPEFRSVCPRHRCLCYHIFRIPNTLFNTYSVLGQELSSISKIIRSATCVSLALELQFRLHNSATT